MKAIMLVVLTLAFFAMPVHAGSADTVKKLQASSAPVFAQIERLSECQLGNGSNWHNLQVCYDNWQAKEEVHFRTYKERKIVNGNVFTYLGFEIRASHSKPWVRVYKRFVYKATDYLRNGQKYEHRTYVGSDFWATYGFGSEWLPLTDKFRKNGKVVTAMVTDYLQNCLIENNCTDQTKENYRKKLSETSKVGGFVKHQSALMFSLDDKVFEGVVYKLKRQKVKTAPDEQLIF